MKRAVYIICIIMISFISCQNDDWKDEVDSLKKELSLQAQLIEQLQKGQTIKSIEKTNTGYQITFSDNKTITLNDGNTPVMTIGNNGNWFIDGKDSGKPSQGQTPKITIGSNGNWFLDDIDTGKSSKGNDGSDAPVVTSIVETDSSFLFYFSDKTIIEVKTEKKFISVYSLLLALGDSMSTKDNYKWKGMLETDYGLKYVRDGALPPAVGGIPLIPPVNEKSGGESIWYRCANKRMSIYTFDLISLFGGTNDIVDTTLDIGTINDVPYLDTTATRPETVTYAAALMGCIEMLQRDFPNIPIVICTITQGARGQWTYKDTGKKTGQVMAEMQISVANKYNLRCVDMFFSSGITYDNHRIFLSDGVHFNLQGAIKMKNNFALTMAL